MGPLRKVLCGVELGADSAPLADPARIALCAADREARLHGAELAIVHVLPTMYPGVPMSPAALEDTLLQRERLAAGIIDAIRAGVKQFTARDPDEVTIHVDDGPPDQTIVKAADRLGADLVVVGSTGAKGLRRLLLGSVATGVVHHGHTSVLVAREATASGCVLLAVDFSPTSEAAAQLAADEARRRKARLCLLHSVEVFNPELALAEPGMVPSAVMAVPPEELRESARARLAGILANLSVEGDGEVEVVLGPAADNIVRVANERRAELVVVGSSGRTALDRLLLGSVAASVVRDAPCSVLVARQRQQHEDRPPRRSRQETESDAAAP
jgi:nucleotide-binding universal stress UspA family protein